MMSTRPVEAMMIAAALTLLAVAVFFTRLVRGTGPSWLRRILIPPVFFACGMLIVFGLLPLMVSSLATSLPSLARGTLLFSGSALVTVAALDGVGILLGAERTRQWLAAGISAAVIATHGWFLVVLGADLSTWGLVDLIPAVLAAAAAITWWPYLPAPEGEGPDDEAAAGVFE